MPFIATSSRRTVVLTAHAHVRAQQRSIPLHLLEALLDHGEREPAGHGAELVHLTAQARRWCTAELGGREAAKLKRAYAVVSADGTVITVGHRVRRVERH